MKNSRHFVTGNFKSHAIYLDDEHYAKVLDNIVVACVDCIIINSRREMLIGKRTREPQPDWWIIGGRMIPGESFEFAAARNLKRELNLDINHSRFRYFDTHSFVWAKRAQSPQENGCHLVSIIMVLYIKDAEIEAIKLNGEYEKLQWIQPEEIVINSKFHPAITKCAYDLINYIRQS